MDDFYERMGVESPYKVVQFQSMSESLKNKLWNVLNNMEDFVRRNKRIKIHICNDFLGLRLDKLSKFYINEYFEEFFFAKWYNPFYVFELLFEEIYDDFIFEEENYQTTENSINKYLEQENSAYRFNLKLRKFIPITNEYEIKEIEN